MEKHFKPNIIIAFKVQAFSERSLYNIFGWKNFRPVHSITSKAESFQTSVAESLYYVANLLISALGQTNHKEPRLPNLIHCLLKCRYRNPETRVVDMCACVYV